MHTIIHEALGASDSAVNSESTLPTRKQSNDCTPVLTSGLSRPLKPIEREGLTHLDRLRLFLATAPSRWDDAAENAAPTPSLHSNVNELLEGRVTTSTPSYDPGYFGSSYPFSQYNSSSGRSTSTANSTYRNNFTFFTTSQSDPDTINHQPSHLRAPHHPALNRFLLPNHQYVTCVLWNGLYHITGTDIVRSLVFRFEARPFICLRF